MLEQTHLKKPYVGTNATVPEPQINVVIVVYESVTVVPTNEAHLPLTRRAIPTGHAQFEEVQAEVMQIVYDRTAKLFKQAQIGIIPVPDVVPSPAVAIDAELLIAVQVAVVMQDVPAKSDT